MNYQDTLNYLNSSLPMYHRVGAAAYKADLDNIIALCEILGNPQNKIKTVHVAGTNGKGSVSHFLASILQENGFKTGLYTSPHLKDYRERIRINGAKIPQEKVVRFVERYQSSFDAIAPSFFEWTAALAFDYFYEENTDIAVIETGLGGRLDSTNIIIPELSVITNISWDHTNLLGDSLEKIATEKAGIIKNGIPVVIGQTQEEVKHIFSEKAKAQNAPIYFADSHFHVLQAEVMYNNHPELILKMQFNNGSDLHHIFEHDQVVRSPLTGYYQVKNIATVLMAVDVLNTRGFRMTEENVKKGIKNVVDNTELQGRWQKLADKPLVVCDTGHNADGLSEILRQISFTPHKKLHMILGFVNDKDINSILQMLPVNALYYFCKASIPRAMQEDILTENAKQFSLTGNAFPTVEEAYKTARMNAEPEDLIFIGGSTFVVA
ncbi:MAG: bifunctional folylpolyglutamate synthase/dihydrofolate synthase, partial [Chloroflexi bacterium]|nr:bifunctional folylpolyglutamate synthase/dihydrofolate synthase [Chloroflexota bacterium]